MFYHNKSPSNHHLGEYIFLFLQRKIAFVLFLKKGLSADPWIEFLTLELVDPFFYIEDKGWKETEVLHLKKGLSGET